MSEANRTSVRRDVLNCRGNILSYGIVVYYYQISCVVQNSYQTNQLQGLTY